MCMYSTVIRFVIYNTALQQNQGSERKQHQDCYNGSCSKDDVCVRAIYVMLKEERSFRLDG
ncbi:hypothetical protein Ngar_c09360 [Candidatus Nitrososphaera gargensis Ga9.2]|uniref:Uncharacterized protein n=1 Tax=Nitrososphaera gargensis (strain Ga9.2) TaxID=1237085 RepID=K0I6Y1_NITGG|nr:hypothetical protein Ngar_c00710 [Candidatus Nitrososphaera gargensis Ga9.2]AFU57878.1 hypothetical protein Ngar_c09360 [Candidatus Nitrososphaera gargensis Ga9.2]